MERKDFLWMILCVVFLAGFTFQSFRERPKSLTSEEPLVIQEKEEKKAVVSESVTPPLNIPTLREIMAVREAPFLDREQRAQLLAESPDDYFDPKRYLQSNDWEYRDKVNRHFHIASWVYSKRKDDPGLRRVMTLLLENGYDIEDYSGIIRALAHHKAEITAIRNRYKELGFYSEEEIQELLAERGVFRRQEAHKKALRDIFSMYGITNKFLIGELYDADIGLVREGDGSIGQGNIETVWGVRLLTDEDWLDEEFWIARTYYQGKPRGSTQERIANWHEQRQKEKEQYRLEEKPSREELAE